MSDPAAKPIPVAWRQAGVELVHVIEEEVGDAAREVREKSALLTDLSAELLIASASGENTTAQVLENRIVMNLAMLGELERARLVEIFERTVWVAARLLRSALGVPA